jgi:hypothetical protein
MRSKLFLTAVSAFSLLILSGGSYGQVNINVGINPPPLVIQGPPQLAVIPGTYVYYCPDLAADVFFYQGHWYRPYDGRYYRSATYEGPWVRLGPNRVPTVFLNLPPRFRSLEVYRRVPYRELNTNWRAWERDRYWDRVARERHERRERHEGVAPRFDDRGHDRGRDRHDYSRERERVR